MTMKKQTGTYCTSSSFAQRCYRGRGQTFFSSLKPEKLYRITLKSEKEFYNAIADYINFYNSERPHSTLKHMTPDEFENKYYQNKKETIPE